MLKVIKNLSLAVVLILMTDISAAHTPPKGARIFFIGLEDGAVVSSPITLKFGIEGFGITPAGTKGKRRHTAGHHHLLLDLKQPPDLDSAIPRDAQHIHFDKGESEVQMELSPGRHTLQLLLGDETHEPHDPPLISEMITITVE